MLGTQAVMGIKGVLGSEVTTNHIYEVEKTLGIEVRRQCTHQCLRMQLHNAYCCVPQAKKLIGACIVLTARTVACVSYRGLMCREASNPNTSSIACVSYCMTLQAARNRIMHEIKVVMGHYGMVIDNRHIMLLADCMSYKVSLTVTRGMRVCLCGMWYGPQRTGCCDSAPEGAAGVCLVASAVSFTPACILVLVSVVLTLCLAEHWQQHYCSALTCALVPSCAG